MPTRPFWDGREVGVPAEIIVAIIGVETYYGRIGGGYRVIDALATLAFDYKAVGVLHASWSNFLCWHGSQKRIRSL